MRQKNWTNLYPLPFTVAVVKSDGWIILKWILKRWGAVVWTGLIWLSRALANM
jgi:hypothetical protein